MMLLLAVEGAKTNWEVIIPLIGVILVQLYNMYLSAEGRKTADAKTTELVEKVEVIHKATNSMKDELVKVTEQEGLARGGMEERARADVREANKDA